jgi:hypothetical protein
VNKTVSIGDRVLYYPTPKEAAKCNFQKVMVANVVAVFSETNITLKYICDGGKDMTKRNVTRMITSDQTEVWDIIK